MEKLFSGELPRVLNYILALREHMGLDWIRLSRGRRSFNYGDIGPVLI